MEQIDDGSDQRTHSLHRQSRPLPRVSLPTNAQNALPTPTPTTPRSLSATATATTATATHPHYIQQSLASQVGYSSYAPPNPFVPLAPGPGPKDPRSTAVQNLKRKRSSDHHITRHTSEDGSGSDHSFPHTQITPSASSKHLHPADLKKRTKTQRACDKCRTKKIRCDVLPDEEPPRCAHCKQYNYECTFFLPITETRFKKRKADEETHVALAANRGGENQSPAGADKRADGSNGEVRIYGPTSLPFLLHSTAHLPLRTLGGGSESNATKMLWNVGKAGDSLIKVSYSVVDPSIPKVPENRIERDIVERLVNGYFNSLAPMFPVVTKAEFLANPNPTPVLLYAICCVAATLRNTPPGTLEAMRSAVSSVMRAEDVMTTASLPNVQALLILGMNGDCHSGSTYTAMSAAWARSGVAIRMAQDLGLHRAEVIKQDVETRRRVWAACVVTDRWYAAAFGQPLMIDVTDCDARLPTPDDQGIGYLNALTRLSMILGTVLKTIYSPTGLYTTRDPELEEILAQLELWQQNLPPELCFHGPDSNPAAGLLHLFYACVCMMFWRVFLRISYQCPAHLKFGLSVKAWTKLVDSSREAIVWLDSHDRFFDTWFLVAYSLVSCALVQYHTWSRRQDTNAVETLRLLRNCVKRWEQAQAYGEVSARRKTAEILTLLFEASQSPPPADTRQAAVSTLEPTAGTRPRIDSYSQIKWEEDPSRPGGGIFVTKDPKVTKELSDVAEGVIVNDSSSTSPQHDSQTPADVQRDSTTSSATGRTLPAASTSAFTNPDIPHINGNGSMDHSVPDTFTMFEGVPGNMFDWRRWDEWLQSINTLEPIVADGAGGAPP